MTSKPSTPSTVAGRALLDAIKSLDFGDESDGANERAILAIESEARADAEHAERTTLDNTRELVRQYQEALNALGDWMRKNVRLNGACVWCGVPDSAMHGDTCPVNEARSLLDHTGEASDV